MGDVFWTMHGIIFIDCPENRETDARAHNALLFDRLNDEIMEKDHIRLSKKSADNSPVHTG